MGFRVAWIARSGTSTGELLKQSRRQLTGERHDFPDIGWYLLELPDAVDTAWVLLIADGSENFADLDESHAQSLSKDGSQVFYFWCSDTVMATELICFNNGAEAWSIEYDCEDKTKQPALNGNPPSRVHRILVGLKERQQTDDGADYIYDLTAELGRVLVGFRHDVDPKTNDPEPFQVLER